MVPSLVTSDFLYVRGMTSTTGQRRFVYISPKSITVMGDGADMYYRKFFAPNQTQVSTGWFTEADQCLLFSRGVLHRYRNPRVDNTTDVPDDSLDLTSLLDYTTVSDMLVFPAVLGSRVITFSTSLGLHVIQVSESAFTLSDKLLVSNRTGLLNGGDNVQWVRGNVQNIKNGELLIGSRDASGKYFETLLELGSLHINGTWDELNLINQVPSSGEIVYSTASYSGIPAAPVLANILVDSTGKALVLSWEQDRPDLVGYYEVQVSQDGVPFSLAVRVPSGSVRTINYPNYQPNSTYQFRVRSGNLDGASSWSNTQTLSRSGNVCKLGYPTGPGLNLLPTTPLYHDFPTTAPSLRTVLSLSSFNYGGGSVWTSTPSTQVPGGRVLSFSGSGSAQTVTGQLALTEYSLVVVNSLMATNAAPFTIAIAGHSLYVATDGSNQWRDFVSNASGLLPPGVYTFTITFAGADAPVGKSGYLSAIEVVPVLRNDMLNGRNYYDPANGSVVVTGDWSPAPMVPGPQQLPALIDSNFPDCVNSITPHAQQTTSTTSPVYFGTNFPVDVTLLVHGSGSNQIQLTTTTGGSTLITAPAYRRPVAITVPAGPQVVSLTNH